MNGWVCRHEDASFQPISPPAFSKTLRPSISPFPAYLGADLAVQGQGGEGAVVHTVLVQMADVQLHRPVVLGSDELVSP